MVLTALGNRTGNAAGANAHPRRLRHVRESRAMRPAQTVMGRKWFLCEDLIVNTASKKVAAALVVLVFLVPRAAAQDTYAGTDAERLSRRVKQLREDFSKKTGEWATKAKHAIEGAKDIERALDELKKNPGSYAQQNGALEAMDRRAGDLEAVLVSILDPQKSNPVDGITKTVNALDELAALCRSDAEKAESLAQNSKSESIKSRYLLCRDACLRNARTYERDKTTYQALKVTDRLQEFAAELEFVQFYRGHIRRMIAHLDAIADQQALLAEVQSIATSLDQLAQALVDFSKIISQQYGDATDNAPN